MTNPLDRTLNRAGSVIVVEHIGEEYGYVAQQHCHCGGAFYVEQWAVHPIEEGWHEVAHAVCRSCGESQEFEFDISQVLDSYHSGQAPLYGAWPMPFEGPYGLRRLDYGKRSDEIASEMESGTLDEQEALQRLFNLIDDTFPTINGRYQVIGVRKGSMGFSYLCSDRRASPDTSAPPLVVCKCVGKSQDGEVRVDEVTLDSLASEARVWAELGSHPNVVKMYDLLQLSPTNLVLVLEAVLPGPQGRTTLCDWLAGEELVWPLALRLARDLCRGMQHCARRLPGFVHGDLKPSNLLVDVAAGYRLKITDFGLSRGFGVEDPDSIHSLGTPMYRAPECWKGGPRTPASDVYAIGLIIVEMASGVHPLQGLTCCEEIKERHLRGISVGPEAYPRRGLNLIVQQSLSVDPGKRPSLDEIALSLGVDDDNEALDERGLTVEWNNKGTALLALGDHSKAIECFVEALSRGPENATSWCNLAVSFSKCGLQSEAEQAYRKCFRLPSPDTNIHANYAAHLMRYRRPNGLSEVVKHCDQAIALDPKCLTAWINKAAALNSLGMHDDAAKAAMSARQLSPMHSHALIELATAYWKLGKRRHAWKLCDKILNIDPRFEPARRLKKLVRNKP